MSCLSCTQGENPFWSECAVKICSENKGHDCCGECPDFPCKTLNDMSYIQDGERRIDQCSLWHHMMMDANGGYCENAVSGTDVEAAVVSGKDPAEEQNANSAISVGIGIVFGMLFGVLLGTLTGNIGTWLPIGLCCGLCLGFVYNQYFNKK